MVNKIGILNGIFLFLLCVFAEIPLGIYFSSGVNSYSGFSLSLAEYGNFSVYSWGRIDLGTPYWWLELGNGITGFIIIQLLLIVSCILTIIGSFTNSKAGSIEFLISILLQTITIIFILIDLFFLGMFLVEEIVPIDQIFSSIGMGYYLLIITLILEIIARVMLKKKLLE
jgi:hypothetical protein